ncbi:MAG: VOC family protein [Myxococcota bacterium]|jgi:catechol 2,3-dioxygenase-like lactoylglutathione lyase family enzyme|nr:VOC family protein [Myxococcota bacterium]
MFHRTDRIVIAVPNLERARREMIGVLGRSPAWIGEYHAVGIGCVSFRLENMHIELVSPREETEANAALRARLDEHGAGLHAIVLESDDLPAAIKILRERGLSPHDPVEVIARDEPSGAYRRMLRSGLPASETAGIRIELNQTLDESGEDPPSLPIGNEAAAVCDGDHVVIFTAAPERAIDLFRDKLDIRLALDRTFEARQTRLLFFRLGGFTIEVGTSLREQDDDAPANDRFFGLAYEVEDIDAAAVRIADAGLEISDFRDGNKPGTRVFTIKGSPVGVPTLIIQHLDR